MERSQILRYFETKHLPEHLQAASEPFRVLAEHIEATLPPGPEKTTALRKLLEGKDAAVRAALSDLPAAKPACRCFGSVGAHGEGRDGDFSGSSGIKGRLADGVLHLLIDGRVYRVESIRTTEAVEVEGVLRCSRIPVDFNHDSAHAYFTAVNMLGDVARQVSATGNGMADHTPTTDAAGWDF